MFNFCSLSTRNLDTSNPQRCQTNNPLRPLELAKEPIACSKQEEESLAWSRQVTRLVVVINVWGSRHGKGSRRSSATRPRPFHPAASFHSRLSLALFLAWPEILMKRICANWFVVREARQGKCSKPRNHHCRAAPDCEPLFSFETRAVAWPMSISTLEMHWQKAIIMRALCT